MSWKLKYPLTAILFRTLLWVVSLPMSLHPTGARWGVCACNAVAITSEYGMARPVLDAREKW